MSSFCKSYSHFFSKKFQHICISLDVNFNENLTNDIVSFEQLGPGFYLQICRMYIVHTLLKLAQLRWTGHVTRMHEECFAKKNPLWRTRNGQTLPWWSEEAIQRHPQSLPQGFQHTKRVMGTNCTGPSKVARPHQKRC